jgi:hypothetical protein
MRTGRPRLFATPQIVANCSSRRLPVPTLPVHADAHGPPEALRDAADRRELLVAASARPDVARVDPVLVEGLRHLPVLRQEDVPVVVEVPDERDAAAGREEAPLDLRDGLCGLVHVHGDPHELRARLGELDRLADRRVHVRRVRVRHGLDDDGRAAADLDPSDGHADRAMTRHQNETFLMTSK